MKNVRETSMESYDLIKGSIEGRQALCISGLGELGEATANELAMHLFNKGTTLYFNRNFVHPRLNELVEDGVVEVTDKKVCSITGRKCITYRLA